MTTRKQPQVPVVPQTIHQYGIYVGAPDSGSIRALTEGIMQILKSGAEQETLRCALNVLSDGAASPSGNSISECNINMHRKE
jgi:hypothetical protein